MSLGRIPARGLWRLSTRRLKALGLSGSTILLAFGLGVGCLSALGVVVFSSLVDHGYALFFSPAFPSGRSGLVRPAVTGVAMVAAWWTLSRVPLDRPELGGVHLGADLADPIDPVRWSDPVLTAVRAMGVRGVSSLPVVDADTGALRGIIGRELVLPGYETVVAGQEATYDPPPPVGEGVGR